MNCFESWSFTFCLHFGFDLVWNSIHFDLGFSREGGREERQNGCEFHLVWFALALFGQHFAPFRYTSNCLSISSHTSICVFHQWIYCHLLTQGKVHYSLPTPKILHIQTVCSACLPFSAQSIRVSNCQIERLQGKPHTLRSFIVATSPVVYWMPCGKVRHLMRPRCCCGCEQARCTVNARLAQHAIQHVYLHIYAKSWCKIKAVECVSSKNRLKLAVIEIAWEVMYVTPKISIWLKFHACRNYLALWWLSMCQCRNNQYT